MTYQDILDLINANLASGSKIQAVKHREVETALLDFIQSNSAQQYDIKAIYANSTYLGDNFDSNGLGKNLRTGWAICNGNNGTPPMQGRTIVNYGGSFTTLNATGGSATTTVTYPISGYGVGANTSGTPAGLVLVSSGETENSEFLESVKKANSSPNSTEINNLQPYIVLVYIMKL
jgi:hypothetical protein